MRPLIIDTDILINFLRGKEGSRKFMTDAIGEYVMCCSVITVAEIYAGMRESEREKTEALMNGFEIIDVTREIAEKAGRYKADEKKQTLELDDCLIAASAFVRSACLATCNTKHYPMTDIIKITV